MGLKEIIVGAAVAGGLAAGALGLTTATAGANPPPPPAPGMPGMPPAPPAGANGSQQVWDAGWQHWGVWMNGVFIPTF